MKTFTFLLVLFTLLRFSSPVMSQWTVQHSGLPESSNPTLIFSAVDANVCWGIQVETNSPKCVRTMDGGANWSLINIQGSSGLNGQSITSINSETAWVAMDDLSGATGGGVFKTTDGGVNWVKQASAFPEAGGYPRSIHFFDSDNGVCTGNPRNGFWEIYTTSDGGSNWARVPSSNIPAPVLDDLTIGENFTSSGNSAWFGSYSRSVYRSTDKGVTWSVTRDIPSPHGLGNDFAFKDEMNGLAVGYFGDRVNRVSSTSDGGVNWTTLPSPPMQPSSYFIEYVPGTSGTYFISSQSNIGFPAASSPGSEYTMDNGATWIHIDNLAHREAAFVPGGIGWSGGVGDIIYKWNSDIVPIGSTVKKLSTNQFSFTEGPVWYNDSVLLFTDYPSIYSYNPTMNKFNKWSVTDRDYTGLTLDKDGNLLSTNPNIIMMNSAGQVIKTLTSGYNGKPLDNPNDLIADHKGGVYFSDPDFFLTTPPQDKTAIYYIDSIGIVQRVIDDLVEPNGLVLSPDGTKLYAVDTKIKYLYSWTVASDGSVSDKSTLAELDTIKGANNYADGMAIDRYGNIYVATNTGIQIFTPEGVAITTIAVPEQPSNCDFGGKDFKTLYITAGKNIYSIDLNNPGFTVSRENVTTAVKTISKQSFLTIYPNPVKDKFTIELSDISGKAQLSIFNSNGQKLMQQQITDSKTEIDASTLCTGIYLIRLENGKSVETGKIIKE